MRASLCLVLTVLVFSLSGKAQTLKNGNFEDWEDAKLCFEFGGSLPLNWTTPCDEPLGFFSGLKQTTQAYAGKYAADLSPSTQGDFVAMPIPTLLKYNLEKPNAGNFLLAGYYQYAANCTNCEAMVYIANWAGGSLKSEVSQNLIVNKEYEQFSVNVKIEQGTDSTTFIFSSRVLTPTDIANYPAVTSDFDFDGELYLDNLSFEQPSGNPELIFGNFTNPIVKMQNDGLHLIIDQLPSHFNNFQVAVYNIQGSLVAILEIH